MNDPITDMFNRIRNAQAVLKETVDIPYSNYKYRITEILEKNSFINKAEKRGKRLGRVIEITLKYFEENASEKTKKISAISGIKRISKLGQRIYTQFKDIKKVKSGYGTVIVSTSKGLMTGKEARYQKLGGEIICEVW